MNEELIDKQPATEKEPQAAIETINLSVEDQIKFAESLLQPPPVSPALKRAKEAHKRLIRNSSTITNSF